MHSKKHLSFKALRQAFSDLLYKIKDTRQKNKTNYTLHDMVMSGFACMYIQCKSLLQFQRDMAQRYAGRSNLQTHFGVQHIPQDTALREGIDAIDSDEFSPIFKTLLTECQRSGQLKSYQFIDGMYLLPLDGTQYHSSETIHCGQCLTQRLKNGKVKYSHKVVQAAIVHPDKKQVLPMMPERIANIDGSTKQDCEINAAKRLMPNIKEQHPRLTFIRVGDSLYAHQPFIKETLSAGDHYIFAIKPGDHKFLTEYLKSIEYERVDIEDKKGRTTICEWITNVSLNSAKDSIHVNVMRCRLKTPQKDGTHKVTYIGTWITDLNIDSDNVYQLIRGARCRWHIENQCFNTLKNQGYYIDHNYGHGEKNLCYNFYILTLLSFYMHQILELSDNLYQKARKVRVTLYSFWENARSLFNLFLYESWDKLLEHVGHDGKTLLVPPQPPPLNERRA